MVEGWPLDQVIERHLKYATAPVDAGVTFRNPQTADIEPLEELVRTPHQGEHQLHSQPAG
jgi:hypothetical protein